MGDVPLRRMEEHKTDLHLSPPPHAIRKSPVKDTHLAAEIRIPVLLPNSHARSAGENHNSAIVSRVSPPRDGAGYVTSDFNVATQERVPQKSARERTKKMQISDTSAQSRQRVHSHTRRGIVRVAMGTE
jgi:hypothetical protein